MATPTQDQGLDAAVADGGAYEVIRGRLLDQVLGLEQRVSGLNERREAEFGGTSLEVLSRVRIRTENNCVPRDIVRVGDVLLFGYNVFIGLKRETAISDVFSAYRVERNDNGFDIHPEASCAFLEDPEFVSDFRDLYAYYKQAELLRMQIQGERLFVTFKVSGDVSAERVDTRVFRWQIEPGGQARYIDDRGEREVPVPPRHDFEWRTCGRDDLMSGTAVPAYSVLDQLFVEIAGGSLRLKVEDNTSAGAVLFSEAVEEANQALNDARVAFAEVSGLLLVRICPYNETVERFYVFNPITEQVERHDEIGIACRALPEDHGVLFPGGYCLAGGDSRRFEDNVAGLRFSRSIRSPNGEDVLYVFYEPAAGQYGLYAYNLIRKSLENPIYAHGYCLFDDGVLVVFRSESDDPSRNHPMQVWRTSFCSEEYSQASESDSALGKIGNNELVRGISDVFGVVQAARSEQVTMASYNALIQTCNRLQDAYFWLAEKEFGGLASDLTAIAATSELVLDEFEKVAEIRAHASRSLNAAEDEQKRLLREIDTSEWRLARDFVDALGRLRKQRGHLITIAELRYIDRERVRTLEEAAVQAHDALAARTVGFLLQDNALEPYRDTLGELVARVAAVSTVAEIAPVVEELDAVGEGLDLLTEILGTLAVDDATKRTTILESISELFAQMNTAKAQARAKARDLGSGEARAEFGAQFTLFSQSLTNALAASDTPERCEENQARLTVALEELEARFGEHDEFLGDIADKREELQDAFDSHKQSLLDARQQRAQNLFAAAERILEGIAKRAGKFVEADELNTYFATDAMVLKLKDTAAALRELDDSVKADDLTGRLKAARDSALRSQRDRKDIFEDGGALIKLGNHRFSVNTQPLDLTIIPRDNTLFVHLTGTGYSRPLQHDGLNVHQAYWRQVLVSENDTVYRGEYLAWSILHEADAGETLTMDSLRTALLDGDGGMALIRKRATDRYSEGYEKGVHDQDAQHILQAVVPRMDELGLQTFRPRIRTVAMMFWRSVAGASVGKRWRAQARSAAELASQFPGSSAYAALVAEMVPLIDEYMSAQNLAEQFHGTVDSRNEAGIDTHIVARYLSLELSHEPLAFTLNRQASELADTLRNRLQSRGIDAVLADALTALRDHPGIQFAVARQWLQALANATSPEGLRFVDEAVMAFLYGESLSFVIRAADPVVTVSGLLGQHPILSGVDSGGLKLAVDEFLGRLEHHGTVAVPEFREYQREKQTVAADLRAQLRLQDFKPRPLSSFVRNRLLNDVYLPIVGDNLAKQMGSADDNKRTDLMGLLLLISPPGYGKTTLMEYIADRLGLVFVKINGPALGHSVVSVDPAQAPNATAGQELEKLNLAFEMGNNVMLYLDDIQHTHPEFLQKFISLCDGTRRIEGVWEGEPKTYDLRGRRFCVVMAGNPYTESGDLFRIPDMLANRADVYNLGDVLSGRDDVFALSFIENSITSNPALAPLATRSMEDVYLFVRRAQGESIPDTNFQHEYVAAEAREIVLVLQKLMRVQHVLLAVNREYIRSAATADQFRTEPPFKLQGSYRNMNKLAEKILPVMTDAEVDSLIDDHYAGEAQLLTSESEYNLLKLGELRGVMSAEEMARLEDIRADFRRTKSLGGSDADAGTRVASQLASIHETLARFPESLRAGVHDKGGIGDRLSGLKDAVEHAQVQIINQPSAAVEEAMVRLARTIETTFLPVVKSMDKKIDLDLAILHRVDELSAGLEQYRLPDSQPPGSQPPGSQPPDTHDSGVTGAKRVQGAKAAKGVKGNKRARGADGDDSDPGDTS